MQVDGHFEGEAVEEVEVGQPEVTSPEVIGGQTAGSDVTGNGSSIMGLGGDLRGSEGE